MPAVDIRLTELLHAYERALIAKVQLEEFRSWGVDARFELIIHQHQELERRYLADLLQRRRESDAQFKAMLDKADKR